VGKLDLTILNINVFTNLELSVYIFHTCSAKCAYYVISTCTFG